MKTIWVNGCFDILHVGHVELFKYAKSLGNKLIVGIDSDKRVKELKGESRPINVQTDRKILLDSIKYIDEVIIFNNENELSELIKDNRVDIMVVGSDYKNKRVVGSNNSKEVIFFKRINGYSTTKILENNIHNI
jgi:D-beta-D-heptose 7-phosphate kinase/D-beta-D-heptose 1-phosphate adenosyltransferase